MCLSDDNNLRVMVTCASKLAPRIKFIPALVAGGQATATFGKCRFARMSGSGTSLPVRTVIQIVRS
ncbi:hypothetical protein MnTg02_01904 [bacterium MnTg02]|nr:hypothetical protein MnTg02_01904 [bacterium MnTg02]